LCTPDGVRSTPVEKVVALSGVSTDGDIIELVNTTQTTGRAITAAGWNDGDNYKAFLNGELKSSGTVTVDSNGEITGFSDTANIEISGSSLKVGGKTATVSAPYDNKYYTVGAASNATNESQIKKALSDANINPDFPEAVLAFSIKNAGQLYQGDYKDTSGDWEAIKTFAKRGDIACPDSVVTQTANKLNNAVSAWGYYKSGNYMVVFFITRSSAIATKVKTALDVL